MAKYKGFQHHFVLRKPKSMKMINCETNEKREKFLLISGIKEELSLLMTQIREFMSNLMQSNTMT